MKPDEVFENDEETRTYSSEIICINCKDSAWFHKIPFGFQTDDYLYNDRCKKCGCYLIKAKRGRARRSSKKEDDD